MTLLSRAVAERPQSAAARSESGRHLMAVTAYELAEEHLAEAARLRPDDPQMQLDLLTLYESTGDVDRAAEARARAESLAAGRGFGRDERGFYRHQ